MSNAIEQSTLRQVAWRIVPFICLLYVLNILDRANVGFARLCSATAWVRIVLTTHPNGVPHRVLSVPVTATGQIPRDWSAPLLVEREEDG